MFSIELIFKNLKESVGFLNNEQQKHVIKNLIYSLQLDQYDEYTALVMAGFIGEENFDIQRAYDVLGKTDVDDWLNGGYLIDSNHPLYNHNLEYLNTIRKRQVFYEEFIRYEQSNSDRPRGYLEEHIHPNFIFAAIEHAVRIRINTIDNLILKCVI